MHALETPLTNARRSLDRHGFFKLICGGSFTEAARIERLARIYAMAGADCIDVAPDAEVLAAVARGLSGLPHRPLVMVSVPLDPDPHFRKIDLAEPDCIRCGDCLPVCPTDAITLPDALAVSQTLCYGCGRCVPVCPTQALHLLPFQVEAQIESALSHPLTGAAEIHSRHVDPLMLETFLIRWQPLLTGKLIALCFNPAGIPTPQWLAFIETARRHCESGLILQIDGAPMSGSDDPDASLPALMAAREVNEAMKPHHPDIPITVSGGINRHTADWIQRPEWDFIRGAGMGTVARQAIWHLAEDPDAFRAASTIVEAFKAGKHSKSPPPAI